MPPSTNSTSSSKLDPWYEIAVAKGWPIKELETLRGLMENPGCVATVSTVGAWVIELTLTSDLTIHGVGRDGRRTPHVIRNVRHWSWRRYPLPVSITTKHLPPSDWCPAHGNECAHTTPGCSPTGTPNIIDREIAEYYFGPKIQPTARICPPIQSRPPPGRGKTKINPRQMSLGLSSPVFKL
jgi:hypothetical protein